MSLPQISVIIPTFNRPALVQQAVESVLGQRGGFPFEILVIDDGSAPATAEALQHFGDRIRYVRQENAGLNPARNHGLRLATGAFIALLDDDDVWMPDKTVRLMAALERYPRAGFVHSDFWIWKPELDERRADGLRSWFPRPFSWAEMYEARSGAASADEPVDGEDPATGPAYVGDIYYWSLFAPMVLPSTAIIRRSALPADSRFPEHDSVGDWEFFARLSHRSAAVFVPRETALNRSHDDAVRLTRTDPRLRMQRRIGLIHRLWRQDPAFMQAHGAEVTRIEAAVLRRLARVNIAAGSGAEARDSLRGVRAIGGRLAASDALLWALSSVGIAGAGVALYRVVRARLRSPKRSGF
jgi:glycosyltransferase involved in cell wall biosynthesis